MTVESFEPTALAEVRARLETVRNQGITIGFAIESGSRAWGFPSPDSDYDCRFVYIRPIGDHLTLKPVRDVIEFPIEDDIDTGGWDLRKALLLALGGNAVIHEWVCSPLVYEEIDGFRAELKALLDAILDPPLVANHYVGLIRNQLHLVGSLEGDVKLKKLFYLLRPIISLQWMEQRDFSALPPMDMKTLLEQAGLSDETKIAINELIANKAITREMGQGRIDDTLRHYLVTQIDHYRARNPAKSKHNAVQFEQAQSFYRNWVERCS